MFIGFEGVDGSGKSTLAEETAHRLLDSGHEVTQIHSGPLNRDPLDEYAFSVETYRPGGYKSLVVDRWHWGELIYGPIYRDESALDAAGFRWTELFLKARGATIFHVTQDLATLEQRLADRGEDFLQSHHVNVVRERFYEVDEDSITAGGLIIPVGDNSERIDAIIEIAMYADQVASTTAPWPQYIGRHVPHTLLVGDKRGGAPPHPTEAPFMARGTSSGRFLLDSFDDQFWRGIGIVNINDVTNFTELYRALSEPSIVALGREASDALLDLDLEHSGVPHPSYVRRFHNRRKNEYGQLIVDASRNGVTQFSWPS